MRYTAYILCFQDTDQKLLPEKQFTLALITSYFLPDHSKLPKTPEASKTTAAVDSQAFTLICLGSESIYILQIS